MIKYRVIRDEVATFSTVKRFTLKVEVERLMTEAGLLDLCARLVWLQLSEHGKVNALSFMFWLKGTDLEGVCNAGAVDWAPYGDWGKADTVEAGDYKVHRLEIVIREGVNS